jgi:hypothetical protein
MFYLFVALKVPIGLLAWIVWWAVREVPDPEAADGPDDRGPRRRRPHPPGPLPRSPRRGPHGDRAPAPPARVRSVKARGRISQR